MRKLNPDVLFFVVALALGSLAAVVALFLLLR